MPWMDQVGSLLKQYTGGAATAAAPAPDVNAHFDQVAAAAPAGTLAAGLAAAFHSDQTPAFGSMLSGLFAKSTGEQKAGLLNQLMANVTPAMLVFHRRRRRAGRTAEKRRADHSGTGAAGFAGSRAGNRRAGQAGQSVHRG